jgi:succinate dehydrogenase / fumarate reductase, membrane anchor subunit
MAVTRSGTGLRAWLVQRATAVYMLSFIVVFLIHCVVDPPHHYSAWHAWITSSRMSIATVVFFLALLAHAWLGLRDVLMDYVHAVAIRVGLLGLTAVGSAAIGAWVIRILWLRPG